jgi:hypothetical protein
MKILEPGRPQKGWSTECVCTGNGNGHGGCGAKLLVEEADLFKTTSHCRDETDTYVTFRCAGCGVLTDLASDKRPPHHVFVKLPNQSVWEGIQAARHPAEDGY